MIAAAPSAVPPLADTTTAVTGDESTPAPAPPLRDAPTGGDGNVSDSSSEVIFTPPPSDESDENGPTEDGGSV